MYMTIIKITAANCLDICETNYMITFRLIKTFLFKELFGIMELRINIRV
jgi:hypothetical protein